MFARTTIRLTTRRRPDNRTDKRSSMRIPTFRDHSRRRSSEDDLGYVTITVHPDKSGRDRLFGSWEYNRLSEDAAILDHMYGSHARFSKPTGHGYVGYDTELRLPYRSAPFYDTELVRYRQYDARPCHRDERSLYFDVKLVEPSTHRRQRFGGLTIEHRELSRRSSRDRRDLSPPPWPTPRCPSSTRNYGRPPPSPPPLLPPTPPPYTTHRPKRAYKSSHCCKRRIYNGCSFLVNPLEAESDDESGPESDCATRAHCTVNRYPKPSNRHPAQQEHENARARVSRSYQVQSESKVPRSAGAVPSDSTRDGPGSPIGGRSKRSLRSFPSGRGGGPELPAVESEKDT